ncbi:MULTISPECIES: hypothetical protein [unclassified Bradyrhizobium]|uniref:hypothetical protein n=1 Tax=unclassified Bradyrhizobium TaxID=2631580 RepID=UPI0028E79BEE|nr:MULTISPECIES: hypothetical protein [unclassified Bradyrhizobium]
MRALGVLALCASLGGCAASAPEVRARLGQEYVGKNVDTLVMKWGPPTSSFRMNSGQSSYVWQLATETTLTSDRSAKTYACKVSIIASPTGVIEQLNTEDWTAGEGLLGVMGAYGSMCGERLGMKPQG